MKLWREGLPFYWNTSITTNLYKLKGLYLGLFVNAVVVQKKRCFFPIKILGGLDFDEESHIDLSLSLPL